MTHIEVKNCRKEINAVSQFLNKLQVLVIVANTKIISPRELINATDSLYMAHGHLGFIRASMGINPLVDNDTVNPKQLDLVFPVTTDMEMHPFDTWGYKNQLNWIITKIQEIHKTIEEFSKHTYGDKVRNLTAAERHLQDAIIWVQAEINNIKS